MIKKRKNKMQQTQPYVSQEKLQFRKKCVCDYRVGMQDRFLKEYCGNCGGSI